MTWQFCVGLGVASTTGEGTLLNPAELVALTVTWYWVPLARGVPLAMVSTVQALPLGGRTVHVPVPIVDDAVTTYLVIVAAPPL
jgi:hypothetical protein